MNDSRKIRLAYFVSHPIQYQAPLLRRIAAQPEIDLTVYFTTDFSVRGYLDDGFGVNVAWDIPLLDGYKYEILPNRFFANAHHDRQISAGICRRLYREKFDVAWLHGYSSFNSLQTLLASRLLGLPVLLRSDSTLHDRDRSSLKLRLKDTFFQLLKRGAAGVLACGTANREYWEHYFGARFPIFNMPYAVDNEFFRYQARRASPQREQMRGELGLEPDRPIFLFAAKLQPRKRCLDLVKAFLDLNPSLPEHRRPYLLIVGEGEDRPAIERHAAARSDIRLLGFRNQSELPRYFDLCDVFVLPSIHEPWGLVVNEAMNAARPIIVSDQVGCQRDLVRDGVNGWVFRALDLESLTGSLRRALTASSVDLAQMGRESLSLIDGFSFEQDIAGLLEALRAVIPSGNTSSGNSMPIRARVSA